MNVKKNEDVNFSFLTLKNIPIETVSLVQYIGIDERDFEIYDIKNDNGTISFNYQFKHKGYHDVHVKIGNDIIASYTIDVIK